jgi:hypothetical protein
MNRRHRASRIMAVGTMTLVGLCATIGGALADPMDPGVGAAAQALLPALETLANQELPSSLDQTGAWTDVGNGRTVEGVNCDLACIVRRRRSTRG